MIIGSNSEMDRAIEYFQQATEIDPDSPNTLVAKGS